MYNARELFSAKSTATFVCTMEQSCFFRKKHCKKHTYNATEQFFPQKALQQLYVQCNRAVFFCKKQCNKRTYKCTMQEFFFCKKHCKKRTYNATEQFSPQNNTATNVLTMQQSFFSAKSTARNVLTLQKKNFRKNLCSKRMYNATELPFSAKSSATYHLFYVFSELWEKSRCKLYLRVKLESKDNKRKED
jgi:hypothetical protein